MKVLVACEESQRVCIEFRNRGHEAYSCDIIDCSGGILNGILSGTHSNLLTVIVDSLLQTGSHIELTENGI